MTLIDSKTRKSLLDRAARRCECQNPECRHHLAGRRCPRGLRAGEWYVVVRERGAGNKLWNLWAMCSECFMVYSKKE
jgi:hypothetical protein